MNPIISEEFKEGFILSDTALYKLYSEDLLDSEISKSSSLVETDNLIYTVVSFDMNKALKVNSKHNIVLLESDSLVIPKSKDIVYVTGSLFNYESGGGISVPFSGVSKRQIII